MKTKSKKSALIMSFTSLMLCFAMLIGSTFAWFTDTATTGVNRIESGTLKVQLQVKDESGNWVDAKGKTLEWQKAEGHEGEEIRWEPGASYNLEAFRIVNNGNLNLKYKVVISGASGDVQLLNAIDFTATVAKENGESETLGSVNMTSNAPVIVDRALAPNAYDEVKLNGTMQKSAGNEYQALTVNDIAITVYATQMTGEYDSISPDYDKDATYPIEIISKIENATMTKAEGETDYTYTNDNNTAKVTVDAGAVSTAPVVTITPVNESNTGNVDIKAAGQDAIAYDIKVTAGTGDAAADVPATIELYVGTGLTGVKVYHAGTEMSTDKYSYDSTTGKVTIHADSYSNYTITYDAIAATVAGKPYNTLQAAVDAASSGDTVTLMKNVDLAKTVAVSGKSITLNLNGKKIYNTNDLWDKPTEADNNWSHVSVRKGGNLTITGNGVLQTMANDCYAVDVQDGGTLTIENGTFVGNIHAVYVHQGAAYINGGTYSVQQKYPDAAKADEFVLNCLDANRANNTAKIIVTGGTFAKFNPADCQAEGAHTNFLAEGYISTKNGDSWTVIGTVQAGDEKELRTALYNAPTDGTQTVIQLTDDITLEMLYAAENFGTTTIADNATGDTLNRYKIGVHPTADDPTHWNPLVTNQTQEEKEAYGAYFHTGADDERIARLVVKAGQNVLLDLNGHNLAKDARATHGDWTVVNTNLVGNYGTLSIIDSEGTGLITGNGFISCSGGVIQNFGGQLTIGDVNIDGGAQSGGGQYTIVNGAQETPNACSNGTIVLDGTHIFDDATSASLICNMDGRLVIKNEANLRHVNTKVINVKGGSVTIDSATVKSDVYAVYIEKGAVTINAMTISGKGVIENKGGTLTDNRN